MRSPHHPTGTHNTGPGTGDDIGTGGGADVGRTGDVAAGVAGSGMVSPGLAAALHSLGGWVASGRLEEYRAQVRGVGGCANPVRLAGAVRRFSQAGELEHEWTSHRQAARALLVPCGSRHASRCPSCAARYRADTWRLIYAGLAGGKGRAPSVRAHPRVLLTLTAPGFGPVHSRRLDGNGRARTCRPRRGGPVCGHGEPGWCGVRHVEDDPAVGSPLCSGCFDYPGAVLFNASTGALWHWTAVAAERALAAVTGRRVRDVKQAVRLSYTRIVEWQARGVVHLHVIVRADDRGDPDTAPPGWVTGEVLAEALRAAAGRVQVVAPGSRVGEWVFRWGPQCRADPIPSTGSDADERKLAGYVAKYVTKDAGGGLGGAALDRPITGGPAIRALKVPAHLRGLVGTCWRLGALPELAGLHLRRNAHQLGYRGPVATRSRAYSSTLRALKAERATWRAARAHGRDPLTGTTTDTTAGTRTGTGAGADGRTDASWRFTGTGWDAAGVFLAAQERAERADRAAALRDGAATDPPDTEDP